MRTQLSLFRYDYISLLVHFKSPSLKYREDPSDYCRSSLSDLLLVEARKVNFLDVSHVKNVLEEGQVTEHVLVWHLDREGSLCSDTLH